MDFQTLLLIAPPILLALTFHEYAHAYAAYRYGDDTARQSGRLTLNPLRHLDPLRTILIFIVHFGWAKPVPVNPNRLGNPKKDMLRSFHPHRVDPFGSGNRRVCSGGTHLALC